MKKDEEEKLELSEEENQNILNLINQGFFGKPLNFEEEEMDEGFNEKIENLEQKLSNEKDPQKQEPILSELLRLKSKYGIEQQKNINKLNQACYLEEDQNASKEKLQKESIEYLKVEKCFDQYFSIGNKFTLKELLDKAGISEDFKIKALDIEASIREEKIITNTLLTLKVQRFQNIILVNPSTRDEKLNLYNKKQNTDIKSVNPLEQFNENFFIKNDNFEGPNFFSASVSNIKKNKDKKEEPNSYEGMNLSGVASSESDID